MMIQESKDYKSQHCQDCSNNPAAWPHGIWHLKKVQKSEKSESQAELYKGLKEKSWLMPTMESKCLQRRDGKRSHVSHTRWDRTIWQRWKGVEHEIISPDMANKHQGVTIGIKEEFLLIVVSETNKKLCFYNLPGWHNLWDFRAA